MTEANAPDARQQALETFVIAALDARGETPTAPMRPMTEEVSGRRFFRVRAAGPVGPVSHVAMDAAGPAANTPQFVALAPWFRRAGLHVPEIHAFDADREFLLVEDLGDHLLEACVERGPEAEIEALYRRALDHIVTLQAHARIEPPPPIPDYDIARLGMENELFEAWFLQRLLGLDAATVQASPLASTLEELTAASLQAPRACVHLDFHCRNLLVLADGDLGAVDFQDAHRGPLVYDAASLLLDCYVELPAALRERLLQYFLEAIEPDAAARAALRRTFALCGAQRHLKAIGIFARFHLRAGRDSHLPHIHRVLDYLVAAGRQQPELAELGAWLDAEIRPRWARWSPT